MDALDAKIKAQGSVVRDLKQNGATKDALDAAVAALMALKAEMKTLQESQVAETKAKEAFRAGLEDVLLRKFFYITSFEIYGGVSGLYDYGPPGCAIMANMQQHWRKHFVLTENMLEVGCSSLTPEPVLKSSGHVDRFTDYLVHDVVTAEAFRADKLIEEHLEPMIAANPGNQEYERDFNNAGSMTKDELEATIKKYNITVNGGNAVGEVSAFNLMFKTSIGPTGKVVGYLRPETAQGIFVNFKRLYEYNNRRLPFAAAQIGMAYRNEISPRGGLLRVREFCMAEIEHFVNPNKKEHTRFKDVAHIKTSFWSGQDQVDAKEPVQLTLQEAVDQKLVNNETLGYFLGRTYLFLTDIGIDATKLRFRQHRRNEMAHYAQDCWDAEINTTFGWIECVGHADRSAYDLKVHSDATKQELNVSEDLEQPIVVRKFVAKPNRGVLGKKLRQQAAELFQLLEASTQDELKAKAEELSTTKKTTFTLPSTGVVVELDEKDVQIQEIDEKICVDVYTPHVIEPSFGLGRIIYSLLEHAYYVRPDDEQRKVLKLSPIIAPIKVALYNVVGNIPYQEVMQNLRNDFIDVGVAFQEDTSKTSIGRKYSRGDEIGIPYAIAIDSESVEKKLVTIRERDSMTQVQVSADEVVDIIAKLSKRKWTWEYVYNTYPHFTAANQE